MSRVITVISAHQVSRLSQNRLRRTRGTVVDRGSANAVNVSRMMTRPPMSRLARVASMPNGATSQPVAIPVVIIRACVSRVMARYSGACSSITTRRPTLARTTREMLMMKATAKNASAGRSRATYPFTLAGSWVSATARSRTPPEYSSGSEGRFHPRNTNPATAETARNAHVRGR